MANAVVVDVCVALAITLLLRSLCSSLGICALTSPGVLQDIASELVGASIGVAGFIIAALTIIITMRDNTAVKPLEEAQSGTELFFNSRGYGLLVRVYMFAALESVVIFLLFLIAKFYGERAGQAYLSACVIVATLILVLLIARCLYLLWAVVKIQIRDQQRLKKANDAQGKA